MKQPSWDDIDVMDKIFKFIYEGADYRRDITEELSITSEEYQYFNDLMIDFNRYECEGKLCNIMDEFSDYASFNIYDKYKVYSDRFIKKYGSIRGYYEANQAIKHPINKTQPIKNSTDEINHNYE
jgi:hypothetical protein